jgi:Metal binding domain of Ada
MKRRAFLFSLGMPLLAAVGTAVAAAQAPKNAPVQPASRYEGNTQTHLFHVPGCRYYGCKACTAMFKKREDAIAAGYQPCKVCKP